MNNNNNNIHLINEQISEKCTLHKQYSEELYGFTQKRLQPQNTENPILVTGIVIRTTRYNEH